MERVSNIDRLVVVLRQRLLERAKLSTSGREATKHPADDRRASSLESVHALAMVEGVDDRQLKRALIHNILADQFGLAVINDAKFQQVVDRVTETLDQSEESAKLLSRLVDELRASAR